MFEVWMSRSAIPARFSASRTRSIRAAISLIAAVALAERVMTPAEIMATSGTPPAAGGTAAKKACFIWTILMCAELARELARAPWLFAERLILAWRSGRPAAQDQAIDEQDDERPNDRGDEAGALARIVPADRLAEESGEQRSGDAEKDGDDAPARIAPGHQQLGKPAGQQADDNPAEDAVILHHAASPFMTSAPHRRGRINHAPTRLGGASAAVGRKSVAMPG